MKWRRKSKRRRARNRPLDLDRPYPKVVRSPSQIVLDTLSGATTTEPPVVVLCAYCGTVATSWLLAVTRHGPEGCVLRSDEDNIGTVLGVALRALEEKDMIDNDTLATEIKATDGNGNSLVFRTASRPDMATRRGRSEAAGGGTVLRCTVLISGQEVTLDARVFEGWARNALNTLDSDY